MVLEKKPPSEVFKIDEYVDDKFLFNGYDGQKILLLDDFKGDIDLTRLYRLLDRWPYRCNVKNGYKYAQWTKIYITSNSTPDKWYSTYTPALKRRLTSCLYVAQEGNTEPLGQRSFKGYL